MNITEVKITQISENPNNPRMIEPEDMDNLIDSILAFPKMQELRPIVVDEINTALGGNMRVQSMKRIADMTIGQIKDRLDLKMGFSSKTESERKELLSYWEEWLSRKTAYIVRASELSESEKNQFIIKDNVSYGEWDTDELRDVDNDLLKDWGVKLEINPAGGTEKPSAGKTTPSTGKVETDIPQEELPEELQGIDLRPDKMEEYESTEDTKFDYIAITYKENEREIVAEALRADPDKLFSKVCWNIDDYLLIREKG